jgi:hypothetical protein
MESKGNVIIDNTVGGITPRKMRFYPHNAPLQLPGANNVNSNAIWYAGPTKINYYTGFYGQVPQYPPFSMDAYISPNPPNFPVDGGIRASLANDQLGTLVFGQNVLDWTDSQISFVSEPMTSEDLSDYFPGLVYSRVDAPVDYIMHTIPAGDISFGRTPFFWTGMFNNNASCLFFVSMLSRQEEYDHPVLTPMNYKLRDELNNLIKQASLPNPYGIKLCEPLNGYDLTKPLRMEINMSYNYSGKTYFGQTIVRNDLTKTDRNAPRLIDFLISSFDEKRPYVANNSVTTFKFRLDPVGGNLNSVSLGNSSSPSGPFMPITVTYSGGVYSANFDGRTINANSVYIKISAYDDSGNFIQQTVEIPMEAAFVPVTPDNPPSVKLNAPANSYETFSSEITFNCTAYDDVNLSKIMFFTNFSGSWQQDQTIDIWGFENTSAWIKTGVAPGEYMWGCGAMDSSGQKSYSQENRTFAIRPMVYNFTLRPVSEYFEARNTTGTTVNRSYFLNNSGNQPLTIGCIANYPWIRFLNCPAYLAPNQEFEAIAQYNTSGLSEALYSVILAFSNASASTRTALATVNVTEEPDNPPSVSLNAPMDGFQTYANSVVLSCTAQDDKKLTRLTLYNDIGGTFKDMVDAPVSGNKTTQIFSIFGLLPRTYKWNCLAVDNATHASFAPQNFTFTILKKIYNFSISPSPYYFEAKNDTGTVARANFLLSNAGNQNLSAFNCSTNATWIGISNCPLELLEGQSTQLTLEFYVGGLEASVYNIGLNLSEANASFRLVPIIANISTTPLNPAPEISNLTVLAATTSATISWDTAGVPSNSSVYYNADENYLGFTRGIADFIEHHSIVLTGLFPSTEYYYRAESCNSMTCTSSLIYSFNTSALPTGCAYGNPACGSAENCNVAENRCYPNNPCPGCGGGGGGGGGGRPAISPTPTKKAGNQTATPTINVNVQIIRLRAEVEQGLPDIPDSSRSEIEELLKTASLLERQGRTEQALVLLRRANDRMQGYITDNQNKKANYTWQFAILILVLLCAMAFYYYGRKKGQAEKAS